MDRTEDEVYAEYRASATAELEHELYDLLKGHAEKLVWKACNAQIPEVVAEAVAKAFHNHKRFKGDCKFSTWFTRITLNTLHSHFRALKVKRQHEVSSADIERSLGSAPHAFNLAEVEQTLSKRERELLRFKLNGHSHKEIADELGLTWRAVAQRWLRLRDKLLKLYPQLNSGAPTVPLKAEVSKKSAAICETNTAAD